MEKQKLTLFYSRIEDFRKENNLAYELLKNTLISFLLIKEKKIIYRGWVPISMKNYYICCETPVEDFDGEIESSNTLQFFFESPLNWSFRIIEQ